MCIFQTCKCVRGGLRAIFVKGYQPKLAKLLDSPAAHRRPVFLFVSPFTTRLSSLFFLANEASGLSFSLLFISSKSNPIIY